MKPSKTRKPYRAREIGSVPVAGLLARATGKLVVAVDVAKEKMVAAVMNEEQEVLATVKWSHPAKSAAFYSFVEELRANHEVDVAMEPTGTYGDALRFHLAKRGLQLYHVNPIMVHDAREFYDGVPSSHDAKACGIIGMLHLSGRSRLLELESEPRRTMKAATSTLYRYEKQGTRERQQLTAMLARFWPGLTDILTTGSKSLLALLSEFGSAAAVAAAPARARELLFETSKKKLGPSKIEQILDNAAARYGEEPYPAEVEAIKLLAADAMRTRAKVARARKVLEALAVENEATRPLHAVVGKTSSVALVAELGDLRAFHSPAALVRCFGLNLKEASSGQFKGRLRITKRGSPRARHYLFYASLRLIYRNPIIGAWYAKKRARSTDSGLIAVVAVMRKIARALWHVARGSEFDAAKLYSTSQLNLEGSKQQIRLPADGVDQELLGVA